MSRNYRVFPGKLCKCPDSRSNFGFVPKQRLLELSPPVLLETSAVSSAMIVKNVAFWLFADICRILPGAISSSSSFWISGDVYFSSLFRSHSMNSGFSWARRFSSWWKLEFSSDIVSVFQSQSLMAKPVSLSIWCWTGLRAKSFSFLMIDSKWPISLITVAGAVTYLATASICESDDSCFWNRIFQLENPIFRKR